MARVTEAAFHDLFVATSSAAAALTGLLFVALSVAPRRELAPGPRSIQQIRAAAALVAFTNSLTVSLFTLVPGTRIGYPALTVGAIGLTFTAASSRSIAAGPASRGQQRHQTGLIILLLLIFGTELVSGIMSLLRPSDPQWPEYIGYAICASLLLGVSRAWELIGDIDTGLFASLAVLAGRPRVASNFLGTGDPASSADAGDAARTEDAAGANDAGDAGDGTDDGPRDRESS